MPETIYSWDQLKPFYNGSILVGNGASIAISDNFKYENFYEFAINNIDVNNEIKAVFDYFETHDFELVLRKLSQAYNVNQIFKITDNDKINQSYEVIQQALISTVQTVHPEHAEIVKNLDSLYEFIKPFKRIISLNYDLLIYWAVMHGNDKQVDYKIKDCFNGIYFDHEWSKYEDTIYYEKYSQLVFYLHGNLALAQDVNGIESKIKSGNYLLDTIVEKWENGYTPLFVSEGTEEQKKQAIARSPYLNTVFSSVLTTLPSDNLTIYGFGFNKQDLYILEQIAKSNKIKRVAVSVYNNNQDYCLEVKKILKNKLNIKDKNIQFFSSASVGEWSSRRIKEVITIENKVTTPVEI
jgi:hypothetical protein